MCSLKFAAFLISGIEVSEGIVINSDILNAVTEIAGSGSDSPHSAKLRKDTHQRFQSLSPVLKIHNSLLLRLLLFCVLTFVSLLYCPPPPQSPSFNPPFFLPSAGWILILTGWLSLATCSAFMLHYANWNANTVFILSLRFKGRLRGWRCTDRHGSLLRDCQETGQDFRVKQFPVQRTTNTFPFILGWGKFLKTLFFFLVCSACKA